MGSDGAGAAAPARAVQTCDGRQAQAVCRRRPPARSAAPLRQGLEAAQGSRGRTWGPSPTRQPWPHVPHHPRLRLLREHSRQHLACIRHRHTQGDRRNVVSRPEKGKLLVANATGSLPLSRGARHGPGAAWAPWTGPSWPAASRATAWPRARRPEHGGGRPASCWCRTIARSKGGQGPVTILDLASGSEAAPPPPAGTGEASSIRRPLLATDHKPQARGSLVASARRTRGLEAGRAERLQPESRGQRGYAAFPALCHCPGLGTGGLERGRTAGAWLKHGPGACVASWGPSEAAPTGAGRRACLAEGQQESPAG